MRKIMLCLFCAILSMTVFISSQSLIILAHENVVAIEYDQCEPDKDQYGNIINGDGEDEIWYYTKKPIIDFLGQKVDGDYHIDDEVQTIKYYFEPHSFLSSYTWTTDIYNEYIKTMSHQEAQLRAEAMAEEIKEAYADSMKKWNDIYYYSYNENGNRVSHKVINIVEGTASDHNLSIYPIDYYDAQNNCPIELWRDATYYACCGVSNFPNNIPTWEEGVVHVHYNDWFMYVNVNYFYEHGAITGESPAYNVGAVYANTVNTVRERTGMHEVGHILGLGDVDNSCNNASSEHHEELLMGYSYPRSVYAKYKDIAGVSITRGFHTDEDHAWMLRTNTDGTQDVICAQCNGVRYDVTLTDGKYDGKNVNIYQSCVHHGGTNQEMLLVASDGERYFYKCQYCRYIATYEKDNATQLSSNGTNVNITMTVPANSEIYYKVIVYDTYAYNLKSSNSLIDISVCDSGLSVINSNLTNASTSDGTEVILEDDNTYYLKIDNNSNFSQTVTIDIVGPHVHSFDSWVFISDTRHIEQCGCGVRGSTTAGHVFRMPDSPSDPRICMGCGYTKFLGGNGGNIIISISKVTVNGSYQMPDGTVYLVDADIEAYLNGTLVFYDKDDLPVVQ